MQTTIMTKCVQHEQYEHQIETSLLHIDYVEDGWRTVGFTISRVSDVSLSLAIDEGQGDSHKYGTQLV
ncbi:hypothetical protein M8J76_008472 [Diaphorina citri]|nr:hypothetical protein M8J76_008472 [Diaphorina citri]